jgi:hypothetical protein
MTFFYWLKDTLTASAIMALHTCATSGSRVSVQRSSMACAAAICSAVSASALSGRMSNRARSASIHGDDGVADGVDKYGDGADEGWLEEEWREEGAAAAAEDENAAAENETAAAVVLAVGMAGLRVNENTVGAEDD